MEKKGGSCVNLYREGKREVVSAVVGPILYAAVTMLFISLGFEERIGTIWLVVSAGAVSGLLDFFLSYFVVFREGELKEHRQDIIAASVAIVLAVLFTLGLMV